MLTLLASLLMVAGCPDPVDHMTEEPNGPFNEEQKREIDTITRYFGTLVGTSPYPGVRSTYGGSSLMAQLSQVNQDLDLLIGHDKAAEYVKKHHYTVNDPRIFLSGKIEGTGFIAEDATGHANSDIGLTGAELDVLAVYKALTGFFVVEYEDFPSNNINNRLANTNLFLDVAFLTLGDLNIFPLYFTIGQTFVPYGQYNSYNGYNSPLTEVLFRVLATDATIGYYDRTFLGQFYFFKGDNHIDSGNNINNFGVNLGAHFNPGITQNLIQVGFIRNIGDCLGFQRAFADSRNTNTLRHVVPGFNINGSTQIGDHWVFVYEYNRALRPFAVQDAGWSTNGGKSFKGARPQAFDAELSYQFKIGERPSGIAAGWSQSFQAVGFNVPRYRFDLTYTVYILKGTLLSIEYMHNHFYDKNEVASGQVAFGQGGSTPYFRQRANKGHSDDTLTIDISFYW